MDYIKVKLKDMQSEGFCFLVPQLYPDYIGGAEVFNFNIIKSLAVEHNVTFVTASQSKISGAKKIEIKKRGGEIVRLFQMIYICIREPNKLIVHSFMRTKWYYVIWLPILKVFLRKRYMVVIHGGGMMKWFWKWPFKFYLQKADVVYGVSDRICVEYYKRTKRTVHYLPPILPFYKSSYSKEQLIKDYNFNKNIYVFLVVGSLKKLKQPMVVLNAIKLLVEKQDNNSFVCLFAGDGPLMPEMKKFVAQNNLGRYVRLLGNLERDKVSELYNASDTYILASDFEGTPIALLEAMFNKNKILAADSPGINNIIKDSFNGMLFKNTDPRSLTDLMHLAIENRLDANIQEQAYEYYLKTYNYQNVINQFEQCL